MLKLLHFFFLQTGLTLAESGLFIVGGVSKVFLTAQTASPILSEVELFGCSGGSLALPRYPREIFGASLYWREEGPGGSLLVCGGADWAAASSQCFLWNTRSAQVTQSSSFHLGNEGGPLQPFKKFTLKHFKPCSMQLLTMTATTCQ